MYKGEYGKTRECEFEVSILGFLLIVLGRGLVRKRILINDLNMVFGSCNSEGKMLFFIVVYIYFLGSVMYSYVIL